MGFHAATIATVPPGASLSIVGTVPTTSGGDTLFAFYNADEVTTPLTKPSDFTQIDTYRTSSYDLNTAAIFSYTANGGAGFPSSGGPTTYTFTTSSQTFPSTSLLLLSWTGTGVTPTAAQSTVIASAHVCPATATLTGCACNPGDEIFVFVAGDAVSASASAYTITATGFTVGTGATGGDGYSPVAVLASNSTASGTSTGSITINIADAHGGTDDFGGVIAWVVAMPPAGGGGGIGPVVDSGTYQQMGAAPARIMYAEVLGPLNKAVAVDAPVLRAMPAPGRQVYVEALPKLPPLKPPPVEVPAQRSLPAALRAAAPEPVPALPSAALTPWADTAPSSRALPAPLRGSVDYPLPAVQVLLPGVPESMAQRSLPPPLRSAQEPALPTATALPTWAAEGNTLRPLPAPLRAAQEPALPVATVLLPWVPDAPVGRALPPPARGTFDSPLPIPPALVALKFAPEGNALRALPPPLRGGLEPALPGLIALPALVPVIDWAAQRLLPPPLRVTQEPAPPAPVVLLSWLPESGPQRALPGPLRAAPDTGTLPALAGFVTWVADGGALRALPPPQRALTDATALPGLPLSRHSGEAFYQRSQPAPLRLTQEPALPGLPVLGPIGAWAQDWNHQRVLVGPALSLLIRADPGLPGLIASIIAAFGRPEHLMVVARLVRFGSPPGAKRLALTAFARRLAQAPRDNGPMIIYDPKHPGDTDSYGVDWTPLLLAGESVVTSAWAYTGPDAALVVGSGAYAPTLSTPQTKVWYSAGTDGATYRLTNTVTTSATPPRTLSRAALLPISSSV